MGHEQFKKLLTRIYKILVIIVVGFAFLSLFSYVYRIGSANSPRATPTNQRQSTLSPSISITGTQPTATPSVSDYRTVLLLERATDLIVTYVEKVKAEQITPDDADARYAYTDALPIAIDAYNQTIPSPGMSSAWKNVEIVAVAYSTVYPILQQGKPISSNDLFRLKSYRQFLKNYQEMVEVNLKNSGKGQDFFDAEREAVEQMLQEQYGDLAVPTRVP